MRAKFMTSPEKDVVMEAQALEIKQLRAKLLCMDALVEKLSEQRPIDSGSDGCPAVPDRETVDAALADVPALVSDGESAELLACAGELADNTEFFNRMKSCFALDPTGLMREVTIENVKSMQRQLIGGKAPCGNRYSQVFLRIMCDICVSGPAAQRSANKFHLLAKLASTTVSAYLSSRRPEPGHTPKGQQQLNRECEFYNGPHRAAWEGKIKPLGHGCLGFDEVVTRFGFSFNARDNSLRGGVAKTTDRHCLDDVYAWCKDHSRAKCKYVMQSMWRCLDTAYDLIGPMMCSEKPLDYLQIDQFFWRSVAQLHHAGFETHLAVCDGASYNLKFIVYNCGLVAGTMDPSCLNPYTETSIVFRFDGPHMLKNLRNALLASQPPETKKPRWFSISPTIIASQWELFLKRRKRTHPSTNQMRDYNNLRLQRRLQRRL